MDYFAVLLIELRLRVAAWVVRAGFAADGAALLVLWHEDELSRCFRPGWPSIGELWAEPAPRLEKPPYVELLRMTIERLGADVAIQPATWRQWCHRAIDKAKQLIAPGQLEEWEKLLPSRFPSHLGPIPKLKTKNRFRA